MLGIFLKIIFGIGLTNKASASQCTRPGHAFVLNDTDINLDALAVNELEPIGALADVPSVGFRALAGTARIWVVVAFLDVDAGSG